MGITEPDLRHLNRCVELAHEALSNGDEPFGSLLVAADGVVLFEDCNRVSSGDATAHPEFSIARWAAENVAPAERAGTTVYTSGEHCPMCSAAHAWVGLGRIVYATSSAQLSTWLADWGVPASPVAALAISEVAPAVPTDGPAPDLADVMQALYRAAYLR